MTAKRPRLDSNNLLFNDPARLLSQEGGLAFRCLRRPLKFGNFLAPLTPQLTKCAALARESEKAEPNRVEHH